MVKRKITNSKVNKNQLEEFESVDTNVLVQNDIITLKIDECDSSDEEV